MAERAMYSMNDVARVEYVARKAREMFGIKVTDPFAKTLTTEQYDAIFAVIRAELAASDG
jgi:hypothetical protein